VTYPDHPADDDRPSDGSSGNTDGHDHFELEDEDD